MVMSLCAALGLHWAALQSLAWAGMLLSYSRSGNVAAAIVKTFDGNHPCSLCRAIGKSRTTDKKPEAAGASGKLDLEYREPAELLVPPTQDFRWPAGSIRAAGFCPEPLVRPPRAA